MITLVTAICLVWGQRHPGTKKAQPVPANPLLVQLENKTYPRAKSIELARSGMVLDGHGATLQGSNSSTVGIHIGPISNVTIKNVKIVGFVVGIDAKGTAGLKMVNVTVLGSAPIGSTEESTGISLVKVSTSSLESVQVHQCHMGMSLKSCKKISIEKSDFSHNQRCGLLLDNSTSCLIRDNKSSFIGRSSVTPGSNAVGIALENGSENNQVMRNIVVHSQAVGIDIGMAGGWRSKENTFQSNDVSWSEGFGFLVQEQQKTKILDNTIGHCSVGIQLNSSSETLIRGNLIVGNSKYGIDDELSSSNSFESNVFAMDTGSSVAMAFRSQALMPANARIFQNLFVDYKRPLLIDKTSPMTLQSNTFAGAQSLEIDDIADVTGSKPLQFDSQSESFKGSPFLTSVGLLAAIPSIHDHVSGVSASAMVKPNSEVVVEGSLTGAFQGEEEVLARYKGDLPVQITFPPRTVLFVRINGVPQTPAAFLTLLGNQSLAKNKEAEDNADTLITPDEATDGDISSPNHGWRPPKGKAGDWWQVDLRDDQTLTAFTILPSLANPNDFWSKFHIQVSSTGAFRGEETTVITETDWNQRQGPLRIYRIAPTVGRYIRIVGDVDQAGVQLIQFAAYGITH